MAITIMLNGRSRTLTGRESVLDLLTLCRLQPQGIIVERNREIVDRASFGQVMLEEGDAIELVRVVGGG